MLPLSLLRNIAMLEKFSALAVLFVTVIVLFTVAKAATYYCSVRCFLPSCCDTPISIWVINTHFIESVGIMAFAFVCHHNTYLIYGSLLRRSYTRFSAVSHMSVSGSAVFCTVLGLAGFLSFMNATKGDLLNNYCVDDWVATVARFLYACVIMLTFPIEIFVCREVLEIVLSRLPYRVISWVRQGRVKRALSRFLFSPRHSSLPRHVILTLVLVLFSLGVGLTTDDLSIVLGFNGCLMATPMAFILPTASYLRLTRGGRSHWYSRDRLIAWAVMVFGVIVMVIGTALSIEQAVQSFSHRGTSRLAYCPDTSSAHQSLSTCCSLIDSTVNLTLHVPLCDCSSFCHNSSILTSPDLYC
ncbi:Putative sodium-coupled neutral amino acid transporter 11 [Geodia barretti]|nr:Putative sodium-coupled neutral amino acid transporter 11 [Geodia barretti]